MKTDKKKKQNPSVEAKCPERRPKLGFCNMKKKIPGGSPSVEIADFHCYAIKNNQRALRANSFILTWLFSRHAGETAKELALVLRERDWMGELESQLKIKFSDFSAVN